MSRNPYLASSRPTSSFTRSSRTASRTGGSAGGSALGRSRSSATLASLSSQLASSTVVSSPYASSLTASSHYVPGSSWQRSSSSTRLGVGQSAATSSANSSARATSSPYSAGSTRGTDNQRGQDDDKPSRANISLYRSTSSHNFNKFSHDDNDFNDNNQSQLKNYQQIKSTQPQPTTTRPSIRSTTTKSLSSQSLDSDGASLDNNESYSRATGRSTTSIDSAASSSSALPTTGDEYEDSSIGDNIPSGSARHLRQQQQATPLSKSKSLEISSTNKAGHDDSQELPLLFNTMSVDRLLLRADSMGERDLRKSFKELVMENERLKQQLKGLDDRDKQRQQEWIRKERQMQRKISELEEENKEIEHWKQEIQRIKDENNSLIRVVSKLSKQP